MSRIEKTSVYVDTSSLLYSAIKIGNSLIDYQKLSAWLHEQYDILEMRAYTTFKQPIQTPVRGSGGKNTAFLQVLHDNGFGSMHKVNDGYLPRISWISQMTIDAVLDRCNHLFFITGDCDLLDLYVWLIRQGVKVTVMAPQVILAIRHKVEVIEFPSELYTEGSINDR